jgi:hypothetical protein
MFLTVHAAAGVIIGKYTGNIWLAFMAGFLSHLLFDIIPHGDEALIKNKSIVSQLEISKIKNLALIDGMVMVILLAILYWHKLTFPLLPILAAITGSILPDFISGLYLLKPYPWLKKLFYYHLDIHFILKKIDVALHLGLIIQLITLIILLAIIIWF